MVGFINRNLSENVPDEYQREIYGVSRAAADSFNWIGTNYSRILNYHAAHDIGHALQNMMLVGCTSFGAWGGKTDQGELILGRNFDFYVGDEFAAEKIVAFYNPDKGHKFMFVTWGGFTGVASGMNDKGLTVTINAARSEIPTGAATPVSLVAREILQYAGNIKEALEIAGRRKMFVSESFLIGSAADHKAVVLEKTPDKLAVYDPQQDHILCTNHYQSKEFENQDLNKHDVEVADNDKNIAPDPFLNTVDFQKFMQYHQGKVALINKQPIDTAAVAHAVPAFYDGYRIAGDYSMGKGWYAAAIGYYQQALTHEIATLDEKQHIEDKLRECRKSLAKK
ncbi:Acyl-coenzyme A:6-aminopenicillanic acid acyl-transferase [Ostertagia ostertagi]